MNVGGLVGDCQSFFCLLIFHPRETRTFICVAVYKSCGSFFVPPRKFPRDGLFTQSKLLPQVMTKHHQSCLRLGDDAVQLAETALCLMEKVVQLALFTKSFCRAIVVCQLSSEITVLECYAEFVFIFVRPLGKLLTFDFEG